MTLPVWQGPDFDGTPSCAEVDPDMWFPEKGGPTTTAQRICRGCEVREECLAWALQHGERYGVWGGLTERERRRLRRSPGVVVRRSPAELWADRMRDYRAAGLTSGEIARRVGVTARSVARVLARDGREAS